MSLKYSETFKLKILSSLKAERTLVNNTYRIKLVKQKYNLIMNTKDFMSWLMPSKSLLAVIRTICFKDSCFWLLTILSGQLFHRQKYWTNMNQLWPHFEHTCEWETLKLLRNLRTNLSLCTQLQMECTVAQLILL